MIVLTFDSDQLSKIIQNAVRIALEEKENDSPIIVTDDKPLTRKQAAEFLGIAVSTLDNYRREGLIKGERIGNSVRFHKKELLASLSNPLAGSKPRHSSKQSTKRKEP